MIPAPRKIRSDVSATLLALSRSLAGHGPEELNIASVSKVTHH